MASVPKPEKRKRRRVKIKTAKQECVALWCELVKARAGYKSELSGLGKPEHVVQAHHILGRRGRLLTDLENGICLTSGEHMMGVHSPNYSTASAYEMRVRHHVGLSRWQRLERLLSLPPSKTDWKALKLFLQQELAKHQEGK